MPSRRVSSKNKVPIIDLGILLKTSCTNSSKIDSIKENSCCHVIYLCMDMILTIRDKNSFNKLSLLLNGLLSMFP